MNPSFEQEYQEILSFLFTSLPMYQRDGSSAYKKDLSNTEALANYLGNPERQFRSVHIAGTNGKGSSAHFMASVYAQAGYKTGLYTSPHLKSFTERIRINGIELAPEFVVEFVNSHRVFIDELKPSFFEITVAMAFTYFARQKVDVAIIEVGMGGRLDSTNIITPELSLITNIGLDHQQWLGDTLPEIAVEKAGIIKTGVPVVISEQQPEIEEVFRDIAEGSKAPITFASEVIAGGDHGEFWEFKGKSTYKIPASAFPKYQYKNIRGVLCAMEVLMDIWPLTHEDIVEGLMRVGATGLKGRWQQLNKQPRVFCDVGHNEAGVRLLNEQIASQEYDNLFIIWGTVQDKDVTEVLRLLPDTANYVFTEASIPRALPANSLASMARSVGLTGVVKSNVNEALEYCLNMAGRNDLIIIGGSNFVVAEIDQL